jgi:hypothetical protein
LLPDYTLRRADNTREGMHRLRSLLGYQPSCDSASALQQLATCLGRQPRGLPGYSAVDGQAGRDWRRRVQHIFVFCQIDQGI